MSFFHQTFPNLKRLIAKKLEGESLFVPFPIDEEKNTSEMAEDLYEAELLLKELNALNQKGSHLVLHSGGKPFTAVIPHHGSCKFRGKKRSRLIADILSSLEH